MSFQLSPPAQARARSRSRSRAAALALASAVALAAIVLGCSGGDDPTPTPEPPTPTVAPSTATPTRTPSPTRTAVATAPITTETPGGTGETVTNVRDLVSKYGYPPGSDFARLRIPALGVDAHVSTRYVGGDGVMANPQGPADVVWYDMSAWAGMGGAPGGGGNAIFSGHVDYAANIPYAGVYYRGQGVFSQIRLLSAGDIIEVEYGGQTLRYAVVWQQQVHATTGNWASIWRTSGTDSITLYTCGGEFDFNTRTYSERIVVRAERIF